MVLWTLALKELRLLVRDRLAGFILLILPLVFVLVLGMLLGEGFGQKPDDRLRISIVDNDAGYADPATARQGLAWLMLTPGPGLHCRAAACLALQQVGPDVARLAIVKEACAGLVQIPLVGCGPCGFQPLEGSALGMTAAHRLRNHSPEAWSKVVQRDLMQTAGIRVEKIASIAEAERLVHDSQRAAVLVFGPNFSDRVHQSSFLADGLNPFYRDGVRLRDLDVTFLSDPTQLTAASIIEQVAQVTLLRVILPWMIGRAFERLGDPHFMTMLADEVPAVRILPVSVRISLGGGVQSALKKLFPKYNLTSKTWASLTKSEPKLSGGPAASIYHEEGSGLLRRGAVRYQTLVPSYTVTFAFFLVLTVSWLFVGERRQGTLKRLRASPLTRGEILLGKFIPCYLLSVGQGLFLLAAGKLVFGMSWGTQPLWLILVVLTTSLAAMGLALLVASVARTEMQVAIFGTLLVLALALISGCLLPRYLMPEEMRTVSLMTPHAWSLEAYLQLLLNPEPELSRVAQACGVLTAFGTGFVAAAWWLVRLD